jgi:hypothetical protein
MLKAEPKTNRAILVIAIVFVVMIAYLLSIGPYAKICSLFNGDRAWARGCETIYWPLIKVCGPGGGEYLDAYVGWWVPPVPVSTETLMPDSREAVGSN